MSEANTGCNVTLLQKEAARAFRAAILLSDFEDKHRLFLEAHPPALVDGSGKTPTVVFYKDQAGAVAIYFGNDGWRIESGGRRWRNIDKIEVAVIGCAPESGAIHYFPEIKLVANLDAVADPGGHCKIGLETIKQTVPETLSESAQHSLN